jgi:hypothetical protein
MFTARLNGSRAGILLLAAVSALAMVLGACTFPSEGCRPEELEAPTNLAPADDVVIGGLSPTLTWSYDADCEPESFRISLSSFIEVRAGSTAKSKDNDLRSHQPPRAAMS